jgi:hypothetical protein
MICGVPVEGETGIVFGGVAVTPVAVPVVLDPDVALPIDPVVPLLKPLLSWFG